MSSLFPPFTSLVAHQPSVVRQTLESGDAGARAAQTPQSPVAQREAMLTAVSFVARCFLSDGWELEVEKALGRVGEALEVSRVTVFEKIQDGVPAFAARYQWEALDTSPGDGNLREVLDVRENTLFAWGEVLSSGTSIHANVRELGEPDRSRLEESGMVSLATVPIFVEGEWWGFLEINDTRKEHDWGGSQLETLQMCADLFGAGIARGRANIISKESEAELRALLNLMSDVLMVLDRQGIYHKIVTSNTSILAAPAEELLS
jgi:GAF domain-containing protein